MTCKHEHMNRGIEKPLSSIKKIENNSIFKNASHDMQT
jgi:hypothetical protein